ncbi:unnamed protein product (mitochondrion) [Plasmodiophora brassicae]|uniref:Ubiquitin carboxyl-terminal hydrolase n=1 Tax=Plasmodiophora brassicae TaxID=37360 RepID=A0A3P3YNA7_PLABS|nr:unnamed protein product [Plasmodiophora brassicae]
MITDIDMTLSIAPAPDASSIDETRDDILRLYREMPDGRPGDTWYLIDAAWWSASILKRLPPARLTNARILQRSGALKPELMEGVSNDYVLVNDVVWRKLQQKFDVAPEAHTARKAIADHTGATTVEVYPMAFRVCTCNRVGKLRRTLDSSVDSGVVSLDEDDGVDKQAAWTQVKFSRKHRVQHVIRRIMSQLRIDMRRECRWWRRATAAAPWQRIDLNQIDRDDVTLDEIDVAHDDFIMVEPRNPDDSWPTGAPNSPPVVHRARFEVGGAVELWLPPQGWLTAKIVAVNDDVGGMLDVQPDEMPSNYMKRVAFDSPDIREPGAGSRSPPRHPATSSADPAPTATATPSSPSSSSSNGSASGRKRALSSEAYAPPATKSSVTLPFRGPGIKGLVNLGNTCFMASTLQCLNRTMPFTEYFLDGSYLADLNTGNPLGMGGELAKEYAALIRQIWMPPSLSSRPTIEPFGIKRVISKHAPMFSGYRQHDSQELLAFLLDGLHEDLNRVTVKPYIATVDSDGRPDDVVAAESWRMHLARNRSVVVDLFQGQLRSTVVCPVCDRVSVTFDPMMYLSLPLTAFGVTTIQVTIVRMDVRIPPARRTMELPKNGTIANLAAAVAGQIGVADAQVVITEIYQHDYHKTFAPHEKLSSIMPSDLVFAYECPADRDDFDVLWAVNYHVDRYAAGSSKFAYPRPLFVERTATLSKGALRLKILADICTPLCKPGTALPLDEAQVELVSRAQYNASRCVLDESDSTDHRVDRIPNPGIRVHWSAHAVASLYDPANNALGRYAPSHGSSSSSGPRAMSLEDCIQLFTAQETLSADDPWFCSRCKEFRQATKKFDLWRLPKILIVHLKRFQYTTWSRSKLDLPVTYPIEGLDLSEFVQGPRDGTPAIYDLYAISNHYGGYGGGHYTALGRCDGGQWYAFDDAMTRPVGASELTTRAAYVLFYERRD